MCLNRYISIFPPKLTQANQDSPLIWEGRLPCPPGYTRSRLLLSVLEKKRRRTPPLMLLRLLPALPSSVAVPLVKWVLRGIVGIFCAFTCSVFAQCLVHSRDSISVGWMNAWMCVITALGVRVTRQVGEIAELRSLWLLSACPSKGTSYFGPRHASSSKVSNGVVSEPSCLEGQASQFIQYIRPTHIPRNVGFQDFRFPSFFSMNVCSFGNLLSSSHHPNGKFFLWLLHSGLRPPAAALDLATLFSAAWSANSTLSTRQKHAMTRLSAALEACWVS